MIYRDVIELKTEQDKFYNITDKISEIVKKSKTKDGVCNIFLPATTAGLMINENDRMLVEDFRRLFRALVPEDKLYQHPENAHSHLRASMLTQNLTIPVVDSRLALGTWQSILLWEFDVTNRERKIIINISC
jgi:secondary thiamine-phosphate synthase enzyme